MGWRLGEVHVMGWRLGEGGAHHWMETGGGGCSSSAGDWGRCSSSAGDWGRCTPDCCTCHTSLPGCTPAHTAKPLSCLRVYLRPTLHGHFSRPMARGQGGVRVQLRISLGVIPGEWGSDTGHTSINSTLTDRSHW